MQFGVEDSLHNLSRLKDILLQWPLLRCCCKTLEVKEVKSQVALPRKKKKKVLLIWATAAVLLSVEKMDDGLLKISSSSVLRESSQGLDDESWAEGMTDEFVSGPTMGPKPTKMKGN